MLVIDGCAGSPLWRRAFVGETFGSALWSTCSSWSSNPGRLGKSGLPAEVALAWPSPPIIAADLWPTFVPPRTGSKHDQNLVTGRAARPRTLFDSQNIDLSSRPNCCRSVPSPVTHRPLTLIDRCDRPAIELSPPFEMASKLALRPGTSALRSLSRRRPSCTQQFSTTSPAAALSPYREPQKKLAQSKRSATTAAAPAQDGRQLPSPAFNQDYRRNEPSPLVNRQMPELDDS